MVGSILLVRFVSYGTAAAKYHRFAALHTYMNKVTGLMVFLVPYAIISPVATPFCWCVCIVAMTGSLEELVLHLTSKEYDPSRKTLLKRDPS